MRKILNGERRSVFSHDYFEVNIKHFLSKIYIYIKHLMTLEICADREPLCMLDGRWA